MSELSAERQLTSSCPKDISRARNLLLFPKTDFDCVLARDLTQIIFRSWVSVKKHLKNRRITHIYQLIASIKN